MSILRVVWRVAIVAGVLLTSLVLPSQAAEEQQPRLWLPLVSQRQFPVPNDPALRNGWQWYLVNAEYPLADLNAPAGWAVETGSPEVTLAVVSSGLDIANPAFQGRVLPGMCFVGESPCPDVIDDTGWGTYVTSLAAAQGGDGRGMAGVAWGIKILPVKVPFNHLGATDILAVAKGLVDACALPDVRVVLVDAGFASLDKDNKLMVAVARCTQAGVLVVAPVGDCGGEDYAEHGCTSRNEVHYPAGFNDSNHLVLAVGATDREGNVAAFSSASTQKVVDAVAPGVDIYGLRRGEELGALPDGTSQAAALAAGLAALVISAHPEYSLQQVMNTLQCSARDIGEEGKDAASGWGLLDAGRALSPGCAQ
jgi:subtilisin family serine protease